jgi:hypothetical protein
VIDRPAVEIACDESGYEGEKHAGAVTEVFAHASLALPEQAAVVCLREARARIGSPAVEYKANHLLRQRSRPVLEWFLGPDGPVLGRTLVHLVDKRQLLLTRLVGALLPEQPGAAAVLYPASVDPSWSALLSTGNELLRVRPVPDDPVPAFLAAARALSDLGGPAAAVLDALACAEDAAVAYREALHEPPTLPTLDPLYPALLRAVAHWRRPGRALRVIHDQQRTHTGVRIAALVGQAGGQPPVQVLLDSRGDPRVRVADFVAGIARHLATEVLHGRGDPALVALLRPYLDPASVWGDAASWARLAP